MRKIAIILVLIILMATGCSKSDNREETKQDITQERTSEATHSTEPESTAEPEPIVFEEVYSFRYIRHFAVILNGNDVREYHEYSNDLGDSFQKAYRDAVLIRRSDGTVSIKNKTDPEQDMNGTLITGVIEYATKAGEEDKTGTWIEWDVYPTAAGMYYRSGTTYDYYSYLVETSTNITVVYDYWWKNKNNGKTDMYEIQIMFNK